MRNRDILKVLEENESWKLKLRQFKNEHYIPHFSEWCDEESEKKYQYLKEAYEGWLDKNIR